MLKSGKVRTSDSTVVKTITWPDKLMYTFAEVPTVYEHLSMHLFISGYVVVLDTFKSGVKEVMLKHLRELMDGASTYRWEQV